MSKKTRIHCDLLKISGLNWDDLSGDQKNRIAAKVHQSPELFGDDPDMYGFVGTRRIGEDIVGGYFVIQYDPNRELHFTKSKTRRITSSSPFKQIFFMLFAAPGKVLLQNTMFPGCPLTMGIAREIFCIAVARILRECKIEGIGDLYLVPEKTEEADFLGEYKQSTRIVKLDISRPEANRIPKNFAYYNPRRELNEIIEESHRHDYPKIKKISLEALDGEDLMETQFRDLIIAGTPQAMSYFVEKEKYILRKDGKKKFRFTMDMGAKQVPEEDLKSVLELLSSQRGLNLGIAAA